MLKLNSKKARENIRRYIIENYTPEEAPDSVNFTAAALDILGTFRAQYGELVKTYYKNIERAAFADWAAGLPGIIDTRYYYNRSAIDDVAALLEETPEEAARYTQSAAEYFLTMQIYRELLKAEEAAARE